MIAALIRWSIANRFLVLLATLMLSAWGVYSVLRTPLDALPDLSDVQVIIRTTYPGPGAAHRREPDHLPADDDDAVGAGREDGARLFVLRRLLRLRAVRGRHRPVLGALARARVPEPGAGAPAAGRDGLARAGRHRRRLDLPVRAGRPQRHDGRRPAARAAGLVPQVRAEDRAQRGRGGLGRRHGAPVPDRARPRQAGGLRHPAHQGGRGDPASPTRKPAARCSNWARPSTWCAPRATCSRSTTSARCRW